MSYRVRDLLVSSVGLVLLAPVLAVIAFAVALDGPGPVLFRQHRVGRGGVEFTLHKFRSMRPDGDQRVAVAGDDRVTRVGAVLRRTKLDELPQLWDVLRGRMSLVGPRPEVPRFVAAWPGEARTEILAVRPGITDPVSLALRSEETLLAAVDDPERWYVEVLLPRKVGGYQHYLRHRSPLGDLRILLATAGVIAPGREPVALQVWE